MKGWLLDTKVVAEIGRLAGEPRVHAWAAAQDERRLFLSVLTLGEIEKGIHLLPDGDQRRARHEAARAALAARFAGRVLPVTEAVARRWGAIAGEIRRRTGQSPSVVDTLLAATAIEAGLYLATRNVTDVSGSGAAVFNPWTDDPTRLPLVR